MLQISCFPLHRAFLLYRIVLWVSIMTLQFKSALIEACKIAA